jgi:hypothetical protein
VSINTTNSFFTAVCAIIIQVFLFSKVSASETDSTDVFWVTDFFSKLYNTPKNVKNDPTIEVSYGLNVLSLPNDIFNESFALDYKLQLLYGFSRFYGLRGVPEVDYFASEYAYISNISSHLKPRNWINNDLTTDIWQFGFGYRNGYGWNQPNGSQIFLYHSGSIDWTHVDFEMPSKLPVYQHVLDEFDDMMKFGTTFNCGILYSLNETFNINANLSQSQTFPEYDFGKWAGSAGSELLIQRLIDYFGNDVIRSNVKYGPLYVFLLKSGISSVIYQLRKSKSFYPFNSKYALSNYGASIGIYLTF